MRRSLPITCALLFVVGLGLSDAEAQCNNQRSVFVGSIVAKWEDGRPMITREPFTFCDGNGRTWHVPKNSKIDGTSIPPIFWSIIGSPFVGNHRKASVVHDHFCFTQDRAWNDVHGMFYEAMLVAGVKKFKALVMYAGVYGWGRRWSLPGQMQAMSVPAEVSLEHISYLENWIKSRQQTLTLPHLEQHVEKIRKMPGRRFKQPKK